MREPRISDSKRKNRLVLNESMALTTFNLVFRAVFQGLPILMVGWLTIDLMNLDPYASTMALSILAIGLGIVSVSVGNRLEEIEPSDMDAFKSKLVKILESNDFHIWNNNSRYLAAERTKNRMHISDGFYALFDKDTVKVGLICELPFPVSIISRNVLFREVRESA